MAGGGGAWKVAYADFVTAMMAFFMVMWLVSQKPDVKASVENYFSDPWARYRKNSNTVRKPTLKKPKAGETPQKDFSGSDPNSVPHDEPEWPTASKPRIVTVRASERTTVGAIVNFLSGSDELTDQSQKRLRKLAPQLAGLPQKIEIRGHVSTEAASIQDDNDDAWKLSYYRCLRVKRFLEGEGVSPERMRMSQAGPYEPLSIDHSIEGDDKNARVEVFLLAETVESLKGNKAERAKTEEIDETKAQAWLEENGLAAPSAEPEGHGGGHGGGHSEEKPAGGHH